MMMHGFVCVVGLLFIVEAAYLKSTSSVILNIFGWEVFVSVGCSILASGIIGFVYNRDRSVIKKYYDVCRKDFGLRKLYKSRTEPVEEYGAIVSGAKKHIYAMGHTMNRFLQHHRAGLIDAGKRGVEIHLLALADKRVIRNEVVVRDDKYSLIKQRLIEEQLVSTLIPEANCQNVIEAVKSFNQVIKDNPKGTQIKLSFYTTLPCVSMLCNERQMVAGTFFHQKESGNTFSMLLDSNSYIFEQFNDHFNDLSTDARFIVECNEVIID